ncbi:MAG: hypothetical protein QXK94_05040 [Candidatus Jordarchaeales archaeon]
MSSLHSLEKPGVLVVNSPPSIERTSDKYYASFLLKQAGIPTPRTVVTEDFDGGYESFQGDEKCGH